MSEQEKDLTQDDVEGHKAVKEEDDVEGHGRWTQEDDVEGHKKV